MKQNISKLAFFISMIIVVVVVLLVGLNNYHYYKVNQTFHICSNGYELNLYLFEKATIGEETAHDVLVRALDGDTTAIEAYVSVDLITTMKDFVRKESFSSNDYVGQYALGIYTIIDKIGQEKFVNLCKKLPLDRRRNVIDNMSGGKFGYEPEYMEKYSYIFKNL